MGPRAAWRLETLGFEHVHDYVGGKADWVAAGEPTEGSEPRNTVAALAETDVPTCGIGDRVSEVVQRMRAEQSDTIIVVGPQRVVLGRLRQGHFDDQASGNVEAAMEEGPTTIRADTEPQDLIKRMDRHGTQQIIVSTPEGYLIGAVFRETLH